MKQWIGIGLLVASVSPAFAGISVDLTFGRAPNVFGSANYYQWTQNAITALRSGSPAGTPDTPTYFEPMTVFTPGMLVVSSQFSWDATVNPGTVFGAAYANEMGSRLALVTRITDDSGGTFDISDGIAVHRDNSPWRSPLDVLYTTYGTQGSASQPTRVGINWGLDGVAGTPDDLILTSGTGLVNEIYMFVPGMGDAELGGGTEQQQLSAAEANIFGLGTFTETYKVTFEGNQATASAVVEGAPEPSTFLLLGSGFALGVLRLRRRK